jgi:transcription antitermination factor NusA-like protein
MGVLITLKVNPEDMGIIIGRGGQNARAIRTLVRVVGAKNNAHVNLRIEEPEGGRKPAPKATEEVADASKDVDKAVEDLNL